jgi:hypothetical protein
VCGEIVRLHSRTILVRPLCPDLFPQVFQPSVGFVFNILSQIGLILLIPVGLEFDFSHLRTHGCVAFSISLASIILPFGLGLGVAQILHCYMAQDINQLGFSLFLATALAITALPVLGGMLLEFNSAACVWLSDDNGGGRGRRVGLFHPGPGGCDRTFELSVPSRQ